MEDVRKYRDLKQKITAQPIIYKWWFKEEIVNQLLKKLASEVNKREILFKDGYALLYIGSGINGHERLIKYHILDTSKFHTTGVENNRLSSLRQTLCGLLECNMSSGLTTINQFIDEYCKIEWQELKVNSKKELKELEKEEIRKHYLPLNWQNTKGILTPKHRKILTELKKSFRK